MKADIGDTVKWSTSRTPLGVVVLKFYYKHRNYVVVEKPNDVLVVVHNYEALEVLSKRSTNTMRASIVKEQD